MFAPRTTSLMAACALVLGLASAAFSESKHFQASQRHFEDIAAMAATLSGQVDTLEEKNLCNYFTATAMAYSIRAHAMAQLSDIADALRQPEERALLKQKITETGGYVARHLDSDLKASEGLAASSGNSRIRKLGLRLVNELRVFEHNTANALTGLPTPIQ